MTAEEREKVWQEIAELEARMRGSILGKERRGCLAGIERLHEKLRQSKQD